MLRDQTREQVLGAELMECEDAFANIQSAMAPTIRYKKTNPDGGYYEGYNVHIKRFFWQIGHIKLTPEIESELESLWCCYHYFKSEDADGYAQGYKHLRNFLEAQMKYGWLFDCEFTMSNPHPYKPDL